MAQEFVRTSHALADRNGLSEELRQHIRALQYFVDTFGYHQKWSGPMYMQIHRTEALKLAKGLGIASRQDNGYDERMISSISNESSVSEEA